MSEDDLSENCASEIGEDCTLNIEVRLIDLEGLKGLNNWNYLPDFKQISSNPPTDNVVVDTAGNIDLTQIPTKPGFSKNVDITFNLVPDVWAQGEKLSVSWQENPEDAIKLSPKNKDMSPARVSDTTLVLNDRAVDGKDYNYKLGVLIGESFAAPRTVDPKIINKDT